MCGLLFLPLFIVSTSFIPLAHCFFFHPFLLIVSSFNPFHSLFLLSTLFTHCFFFQPFLLIVSSFIPFYSLFLISTLYTHCFFFQLFLLTVSFFKPFYSMFLLLSSLLHCFFFFHHSCSVEHYRLNSVVQHPCLVLSSASWYV